MIAILRAFAHNPTDWIYALRIGLRRRSAMYLDYCGLPVWLVNRICPEPSPDWGSLLFALADGLGYGYPYDYEVDTEDDA